MATPDPQKVLQLAADLLAAQAAVDSLQKQWDALFSMSQENKVGRKRDPNGPTSRILSHLETHASVTFNAQVLSEVLSIDKEKVESALNNVFVAGEVKRPARGLYQANIEGELQPV